MNKLLRNSILFLLPLLLGILVLPVDQRLKYRGLKGDCFNHGIWIYDRLHNKDSRIDLVFLGSSHTINAVDDSLLSKEKRGLVAVNFGYCRLGRNLHHTLLKEILSEKEIHTLVLEIRGAENRYGHPVFPFIASDRDVLFANPFFNPDFLSDIWEHGAYKVELFQERIFNHNGDLLPESGLYGHAAYQDTASAEFLNEARASAQQKSRESSVLEARFYDNFAHVYLKKIDQLCKKNDIRLVFLYLPSFGRPKLAPTKMAFYKEMGEVLIPPGDIYDDMDNWYDEGHLNAAGADKLSRWLSDFFE